MRGADKMRVPTDFDRDLWFDPLTFQGLVGRRRNWFFTPLGQSVRAIIEEEGL